MKNIFYKVITITYLCLLSTVFLQGQSITLVSPNGGEVWEANTQQEIRWTGSGIYGSIYIEYSVNGGQTWTYLYWGWSQDTGGMYMWTVPFVETSTAKVKVTYWNNQSVFDISDNNFQIILPDFALIAPNGGQNIFPGNTYNIQWNALNSNNIDIEYSTDAGSTWDDIALNVDAALGSYAWLVPNTPSNQCRVRITDTDDPLLTDMSNNNFTIKAMPQITLLQPNGGEQIEAGSTYNIQWVGQNIYGNIYIDYTVNNGQTWQFIGWGWSTDTGAIFSWTVPVNITNNAKVRVRFWDNQTANDTSDMPFSIVMPAFKLTYPAGNESFYPTNTMNIQWNADNSNYVNIEFSSDNGNTWTLIKDSVPAQQNAYAWTVPNTPSTQCFIRIIDSEVPTTTDKHNNPFTIRPIPTLELVTPVGGENFIVGDTIPVEWVGTDLHSGIYIEVSYNNGATWSYMAWIWGTPTGGTHNWIVPNNITTNALIKITYWDLQSVNAQTATTFSISPPPFAIIAPTTNATFYPTQNTLIEWYASGIDYIHIDYSHDNGNTWIQVAQNVNATLNSYSWTVPNTPSTNCRIRLTDADDVSNEKISGAFTIYNLPVINIVTPNGGEQILAGSSYQIQWTGTHINNAVTIEYSLNAGSSWQHITSITGTSTGGSYNWTVPNTTSNNALIRVRLSNFTSVFDVSDAVFSIILPDFVLLQPNGGNTFYEQQQTNIQWQATGSQYLLIELSIDNGATWQPVADSVNAATGNFSWTVPNAPSTQCRIKITDMDMPAKTDMSDNVFTIKQMPTIQLVYPNGGEVFEGGQNVTIEWTGTNISGNIYIEFSTNGGSSWSYLAWGWGNNNGGTYNWTVPFVVSSNVLVRVKFWDMQSVNDQSDATFTIQLPPFVLTAPNGGESLYPGNNFDIKWNALNSNYIDIYYTIDNGNSWILIAANVLAASNLYAWSVPNTPSAQCRVKIVDADDNTLFDTSNNIFTINALPTINIVAPNGGELFTAGDVVQVVWSGTNLSGNIYLEYSANGGSTWSFLAWGWGTATGGSVSWTVPFIQTQTALVRARFWSMQSVVDQSDNYFSIQLPPFALISPMGGNNFFPSSNQNIQWVATNTNYIRIEYTIDNANSWLLIADSVTASLNSYQWTVPNTPSTQCRVRITNLNDTTEKAQSTSVFTIKVMPTVQLVTPAGGEVWTAGDQKTVTWTGTNLDGNLIVEFSTNDWFTANYVGGVWGASNGGSVTATLPLIQTNNAKIRVRLLEAPAVKDENNPPFSIVFPPFSLTAPNGGGSYYPYNQVQIKWYAANVPQVRLDYSTDNGQTWINIEQSINGTTGVYNWVVPNTPSIQCLVRISDVNDPATFDISNATFTIRTLPTIQLQSPNGGEVLVAGVHHSIVWTGNGLEQRVDIDYSPDLGLTWMGIAQVWNMYTGGTVNWLVPYNPTPNALVRVRMFNANSVSSQSVAPFTIINPDIAVITPNGGNTFFPYNTVPIKWVAGQSDFIKIEYTYDNDTTWHIVANYVPADLGQYDWTVPNTPSNYCRIRISDASNVQLNDVSNSLFSIKELPLISLLNPNGGEIFTAGTKQPVFWTGHNLNGFVVVAYSLDNWSTQYIQAWKSGNLYGDSLLWTVPYTPSTNARLKVYFNNAPAAMDETDAPFIIQNPSFGLISPNGGQSYFPTNEVFIQWVAENSQAINIEYTTDAGSTWQLIASNVNANLGQYNWIVPNTPSDKCLIRISDALNPFLTAQSLNYFRIYPEPVINMVYPNGYENLTAGNTYPIEWSGTHLYGAVRLEYSTDGAVTWQHIEILYNMANGGMYLWQVPYDTTNKAKVRATFLGASNISDESDNFFSISYPNFALLAPHAQGLTFYPSTQMDIEWIAANSNLVKLLYTIDNGLTWHLIDENIDASLGTYSWTVPNTPSSTCKIRIVDMDNPLTYDTSNNNFTILYKPDINLVSPLGGEDYRTGDTIVIRWEGVYITGGLYIDYSIDYGATWINIDSKWGSPNGDFYNWIAPHMVAQVLVRLTYIDMQSISVQCDSVFTICYNPALQILSNPVVCQPHTVDITAYFTDSLNAPGSVSFWYDSLLTQIITDPTHLANSGTYYIYKFTDFGSCSDLIPIDVVVGSTPVAPLVNTPHYVCSDDTLNLLEAQGQNIEWYYDVALYNLIDTGNYLNTAMFTGDTVIYVFQFEHPSCPSNPAAVNIIYNTSPLAPVIPAQADYCAGDSINEIMVSGTNVYWYSDSQLQNLVHNGNTLNLLPLFNDTVFYVIQSDNNCLSPYSTVNLTVYPKPPKPTISQVGNQIMSSSPTGNQWFNTQGTYFGNNQYFLPPAEDFYMVVVNINGCLSDTSDVIYYFTTGSAILTDGKNINVFPNPFDNEVFVALNGLEEGNYIVELFNLSGQMVYSSEMFNAGQTIASLKISTQNMAKGIYHLRIYNEKALFTKKLIKH